MSCYLEYNCKKFKQGLCKENEFCIRRFREDSLFDLGLIELTQRYRFPMMIFSNDPVTESQSYSRLSEIEKNILEEVSKGTNIYIYSTTCGNGKTAWSLRLAQSYVDKIWHNSEIRCRVLFISVPKFLLELKSNISVKSSYIEHIKKYVLDADLVIWDDIGSKCGTEFEIENMLSLINNRLDSGKSNIYTSNVNPETLEQILGPRLSSRIKGMSQMINFQGRDKRGVRR